MGTKKKFTPEELKHLQANPYTLRVTADSISYTLAFKEAFWALSLQGYTGTAAFRKLGYNTEVLGFERIHNTTKRIRREARSPEGFHEGARGGVRIPGGGNNQTEGASAPSDEAARRMKREILCLQQQMAFLKKLMRQPEETDSDNAVQDAFFEVYKHNSEKTWKIHGVEESINFHRRVLDALKNRDVAACLNLQNELITDKSLQE